MVAFVQRYRALLVTPVFLLGLAFVLATIGCESESPTSVSLETPTSLDSTPALDGDDKVYLVFSPEGLSAAKVIKNDDGDDGAVSDGENGDGDGLSTSALVQPDKPANLKVGSDGLKVMLHVPKGAVAEPVLITMGVHPGPLSLLVVEMGPVGQVFDPSAVLKIVIDADLVDFDLSLLEALVASDDDFAPATIVSVETDGDEVTIRIDVHHFSRYGLRNSSSSNIPWYYYYPG